MIADYWQSSRNSSVLSDMTSKILADIAKDWHKKAEGDKT
jgi:trehalose/maltose hydrolase-like predicted phosphorylase